MTFDLTFDETFTGLIATGPVNVNQQGCQSPGIHLMWLSRNGWAYWLFSGYFDEESAVGITGQYVQGELSKYTQKITAQSITARAGNVDKNTALALTGIFESVAVYLLTYNENGAVSAIPVSVEPGTFGVWKGIDSRANIDVKIILPGVRSARQ